MYKGSYVNGGKGCSAPRKVLTYCATLGVKAWHPLRRLLSLLAHTSSTRGEISTVTKRKRFCTQRGHCAFAGFHSLTTDWPSLRTGHQCQRLAKLESVSLSYDFHAQIDAAVSRSAYGLGSVTHFRHHLAYLEYSQTLDRVRSR